MLNIIVAIYDKIANYYACIRQEVNRGTAIRWFQDDVCSKEGPVRSHPKDYSLVLLGEYNPETGEIKPCLEKIIEAADCVPSSFGSTPDVDQPAFGA